MATNKNRRAQASKRARIIAANQRPIDAIGEAEVNRARSSAGAPHRMKTDYRRTPKHKGQGWD